ncbi:STAS/SEC14 domain-containing protein [Robertkochia marina]|uniref:STAS/SEC14 domain-containing protein n=1 Tax=Robertkochia marina TaxID=1227945 RepID=A0A4S3M0Y8_9FLAO|nr:STAS/SEC14 domain-containing protein [Robertkochia marina]THD66697.1 STAS/SEC14 domain-containing protein [Robertkochia marina]TRZ45465.1 STAS/SEC14 domain-containing protein [Robertkochia marina]
MEAFPPFPEKLIDTEKIDTGTFYIYPGFVIGIISEGANLKLEQLSSLVLLYEKYFSTKDFVYISYRVNSYSIDPTVYPYLLEIKTLKGIAVVTEKESFRQNFQIEKVFYSGNIRIFPTILEAISWANSMVD